MTAVKATVLAITGPEDGTNKYCLMFEHIVETRDLMLVGLQVSGSYIQEQDIRQGDTVVLEQGTCVGVYVQEVDMEARPPDTRPTIVDKPEPDEELVFVVRAMVPPGADLPAATEKMERALQQVMGPLVENTDWHNWSVQALDVDAVDDVEEADKQQQDELATWAAIEREVDAP